jgi:hypothetical protein
MNPSSNRHHSLSLLPCTLVPRKPPFCSHGRFASRNVQVFIDETKILKLIDDHLVPPPAVLQWWLAKDEEIPTPNTNEIVVSKACDFFRGLISHYKIELVHLNPNFVLQITVFLHLHEAYLDVLPNFSLSSNIIFS